MSKEKKFTLDEAHRQLAIQTNGRIWTLLEKKDRTSLEDDELLYAAYASCYYWLKAGTGVNQQRGEYLIAKAYMSLNSANQALYYAKRCLALTEKYKEEMKDFDIAFAYECLARAYAMNKNKEDGLKYYQLATKAGQKIVDAEDKKIFDGDMAGGEWFGLIEN